MPSHRNPHPLSQLPSTHILTLAESLLLIGFAFLTYRLSSDYMGRRGLWDDGFTGKYSAKFNMEPPGKWCERGEDQWTIRERERVERERRRGLQDV